MLLLGRRRARAGSVRPRGLQAITVFVRLVAHHTPLINGTLVPYKADDCSVLAI